MRNKLYIVLSIVVFSLYCGSGKKSKKETPPAKTTSQSESTDQALNTPQGSNTAIIRMQASPYYNPIVIPRSGDGMFLPSANPQFPSIFIPPSPSKKKPMILVIPSDDDRRGYPFSSYNPAYPY
ncbi:MAG: hypothetical protein H7A23_13815 [Leptospiraceae bacterium]|nr:hypothetical protein [Leptospiraceae bacterium]MCP5495626.1 hypothetical protein [Leptospiraceae bacterium]